MADVKPKLIAGLPEEELFAPGHAGCLGCGEAIAIRHILKAAGPNTIITQATGCPEVYTTLYPYTAWMVPWIHVAFENAAATASGIREGLNQLGKRDINVIAMAGDGGTFDIGFQALSGMLERRHKVLFICLDNGAYENTGVQRSGATPKYAWTTTSPVGKAVHGKKEWPKPMPLIVGAHQIPYVATASVSNILDLFKKVQKALKFDGPSYIQVLCPCIPGWKMEPNKTMELADKAVKTNIHPLYEIENGLVKVQDNPNPLPVTEFFKGQGRFKHLTIEEIKDVQNYIDEEYKKLKDLEKAQIKL